jgi:hypothetical protein
MARLPAAEARVQVQPNSLSASIATQKREDQMRKLFSALAAASLIAGLTIGTADAKPRKTHTKTMSGQTGGTNSANSMAGKNSPASSAKGSASPAGGGEK